MLTTTFRLLRKHGACAPQYTILRKHLRGWGQDKSIPLAISLGDEMMKVPDWEGLSNAVWALQAVPEAQAGERDRLAVEFSAELLGRIPDSPPEHVAAVAALRAFTRGEVSREEVQSAARSAWAVWEARGAWAAWAAWYAWYAWSARSAWRAWYALYVEYVEYAEYAWAARAARAAWAAWAAWAAREDKGTQEARAEATALLRRLLEKEEN